MRILILGGTGAMGIDLIKLLAERGDFVDVTSRKARHLEHLNINFIQGNAHDMTFLGRILDKRYDAIVDFMIYDTPEFEKRVSLLCGGTHQYIFLSSARVYADSLTPITEDSPRLLDIIDDKEYLATDEYALTKARQENILRDSAYYNWTIIRPYVTYNIERLQLGWMEKEKWLFRAVQGKKILFSNDIMDKKTTLTYGFDVAHAMACLVGNPKAMSEVFHITGTDSRTWSEVLEIYLGALEKAIGMRPEILLEDTCHRAVEYFGSIYQAKYDRLYNRIFDNSKIRMFCKRDLTFTSMTEGLAECVEKFLGEQRRFQEIDWGFEGYVDRLTGDRDRVSSISDEKNKLKYVGYKYTPGIMEALKKIKRK